MPDAPRQIRLAAGDYYMHGQDHKLRRAGLPGYVCRVVLRLEDGLDVDLLRRRVETSPVLNWLAHVRLTRPLPVFPPLWRTTSRPSPIFFEHNHQDGNGAGPGVLPPAVLERDLHAGRGPALAFDLVRHADGTRNLIFSWNHALMDARGAELIWLHLNADGPANGAPSIEDLIHPKQRGGSLAEWWRNVKLARGSVEWLRKSGSEPLFSLLPEKRTPGPHRNQSRIVTFSAQETARIEARCERLNAGFRRSHFLLAGTLRALHTVATRRGNKDGAYLIPVAHDTRRRGAKGPIFSNHLSILFYRIEPQQAGSLSNIISELTRQMMDQIRTRFPESCMAALEMFKPLPLNSYMKYLGKPTRGKFATLCFSDSGETCAGMTEMLGGRIRAVDHLVPTWWPPGLTVVFWSFSGRLSVLLSWVDDCLSVSEVDALEHGLRSALLEEEAP
jgi:hypothetical protein